MMPKPNSRLLLRAVTELAGTCREHQGVPAEGEGGQRWAGGYCSPVTPWPHEIQTDTERRRAPGPTRRDPVLSPGAVRPLPSPVLGPAGFHVLTSSALLTCSPIPVPWPWSRVGDLALSSAASLLTCYKGLCVNASESRENRVTFPALHLVPSFMNHEVTSTFPGFGEHDNSVLAASCVPGTLEPRDYSRAGRVWRLPSGSLRSGAGGRRADKPVTAWLRR